MMNNSKILTVSYGTFSCTLEGFDDSFGTMKAIAEYFRDLAADDRYFGAEPPQPDAEMLARIAEKEVSRRVAAREQDGTIVLSALEADEEAQAPAPQETPSAAPAAAAAAVAAPVAAVAAEELLTDVQTDTLDDLDDVLAPEEDVIAPEDLDLDLSAEDLAPQIDPVVEEEAAAPEIDDGDDDLEAALSAAIAEESAAAAQEPVVETPAASEADVEELIVDEVAAVEEAVAEAVADEPDIVPGQPDAEVEAFFAEAEDQVEEAPAPVEEPEVIDEPAAAAPAPDSIAAKLQRIRAVVSQQAEARSAPDYSEDEHAEPQIQDPIAEARADIEEALEIDDAALAPKLAEQADDSDAAEEFAALMQGTPEADEAPAEEAVDNLFEAEEQAPAAETPRARVIKVKRDAMEAAIEQSELEPMPVGDDAAAPSALDELAPSKQDSTSLSAEEEADLARELSALTEETNLAMRREAIQQPVAEEPAPEAAAPPAEKRRLPEIDRVDAGDMNRLMAETNNQMAEPENATRRDAFAHLRAAVAARKADASIDAEEAKRKEDGAYREDLAEVVRPRRRTPAGESQTPRPEPSPRAAPLKLVAEQRVDVADASAASQAVRPRRVAALEEDHGDAEGFVAFAAEAGAHALPDLLEAAAAYLSFVEGREQFSRPQLMTKVRQASDQANFSREEGLRSFGKLLRDGKIEKIRGGRFTAADDIGFRPDALAAG